MIVECPVCHKEFFYGGTEAEMFVLDSHRQKCEKESKLTLLTGGKK